MQPRALASRPASWRELVAGLGRSQRAAGGAPWPSGAAVFVASRPALRRAPVHLAQRRPAVSAAAPSAVSSVGGSVGRRVLDPAARRVRGRRCCATFACSGSRRSTACAVRRRVRFSRVRPGRPLRRLPLAAVAALRRRASRVAVRRPAPARASGRPRPPVPRRIGTTGPERPRARPRAHVGRAARRPTAGRAADHRGRVRACGSAAPAGRRTPRDPRRARRRGGRSQSPRRDSVAAPALGAAAVRAPRPSAPRHPTRSRPRSWRPTGHRRSRRSRPPGARRRLVSTLRRGAAARRIFHYGSCRRGASGYVNAKTPARKAGVFGRKNRRRPTLPGGLPPSTIGAGGLNCRVRNGNGCVPAAMVTGSIVSSRREPENSIASTNVCQKECDQALGRLVPVG